MQWYIWGIYHVAQQGSTQIICCISKSVVLLSALCRTKITSGRIVSSFIPGSKIKLTACITKFKISRSEYIENGLCSSFAESDISNIFKTLGHKSSQASNQKNMEERNPGSMQIIFFAKVSRVWQNSHFQKQKAIVVLEQPQNTPKNEQLPKWCPQKVNKEMGFSIEAIQNSSCLQNKIKCRGTAMNLG